MTDGQKFGVVSFGRKLGHALRAVVEADQAQEATEVSERVSLGFFRGTSKLNQSLSDLRQCLTQVRTEFERTLELVRASGTERDSEVAAQRIAATAGQLLAWDRRVKSFSLRGRPRRLLLKVRGLGRTYFDRIHQQARLLARDACALEGTVDLGLDAPAWFADAERDLTRHRALWAVVWTGSSLLAVTAAASISWWIAQHWNR